MDDYKIALGALLDANAKGDIDKQLNAIKDLSVTISKATLSNDAINDIKRQLTQNGIDLKLAFGNTSQITNQAKQVGQQIGQQVQNGINSAIQKGNLQKEFFFPADKKNDVAKRAQEYFRGISNGVVTVTEQMENLDNKSELRGFIVNIKNAKGEVESLKYSLRNILDDNGNVTGQKFAYISGSINDASVIKQFEELNKVITDYEIKLSNFKTKYSNFNVDYKGFDKVFGDFKSGIATTNELALAFNQLENSAKKGVQSLKSQTSSFDPIQQTLNNMRDLPSMLTALEANMSGVKDKTSIAEISVSKLRESFDKLDAEMQSNGGKVPITDEWLKNYRDLMSTVTSATKQVDALKKAEASDNSQTQKQANYYSTILSNYREIHSLKQKLLTAGKEETKVIQEQIRSLNSSNASINKQLGKQGLKDNNWQTQVDDLKKGLDYSLRISEARQKDKATQSSLNDSQKESIKIIEELETSYQRVQDIKVKIASLDKEKDGEKISTLSQEEKTAQDEYNQLYNKLRKRKNYDKESWNEIKSAIDAATKSQIEFNNAKSQDTLNKAQKTEVANFNILKNKWEEQGILVGDFKKKVEDMESSLASVGSKGELDNLKIQIKDLKTEASQIAEVNKIQLSFETGNYNSKVDYLIARTKQWTDANGQTKISTDALKTALDNLGTAYNNLNVAGGNTVKNQKALIEAESMLNIEVKKVSNEVTKMSATFAKSSSVDSLRQRYQEFYDKNTAAHKRWGATLKKNMTELASGAEIPIERYKALERELINVGNSARQAGKLGLSFFDKIKQGAQKFTYWTSSTFIVMKAVQEIKRMVEGVGELDDALTNISYTMGVSNKQLEKIGNSSLQTAKDLHTSAKNVLDAVKTYANAKETSDSIINKAKPTIMMSNVTGMSTEDTVDIIQGTVEQFNLDDTEEQLMHISDVLQTVSANMPMDFSKGIRELSEGLQTSGETARQSGYDLERYSALLGNIIAKTRQSGSEVGRSLRTMMLRTTKVSTSALASGEVTEEDLSNAETALRRVGIEMRSDTNTFKEFDQIISELYNKLDTLSYVDMSNLSYELAGIRQANTFKMMIKSYGSYLDMVEKVNDADGATSANQEKYAESLKGKTEELSAIWTKIGDDAINSSFLKGLVGAGTAVSGLIEKFGLLKTAIVGITMYTGIKNNGRPKMFGLYKYAVNNMCSLGY